MTRTPRLLAAATLLAAGAAHADTTYTVDKVTITGSKTVPTSELMAVVQEHKGSRVTQADIVADQDAIVKLLGERHVGGGIKTSMAARGSHVEVTFMVNDQGAQAAVVHHVAPTLHAESFVGNKVLTSDQLTAAAGLAPGQQLTDAKIQAAQQGIVAAYKAAKKPIDVNVSGAITPAANTTVDVVWTVKETKGKAPKQKDDRSQEAQDQIQ